MGTVPSWTRACTCLPGGGARMAVCTRHPVLVCVSHMCVHVCGSMHFHMPACAGVCLHPCESMLPLAAGWRRVNIFLSGLLSLRDLQPTFLLSAASNPSPTFRSLSKDSSSASALTFQLIPALKAQMFPGTPQPCHLGWVLSPCSIFSSVKWTPNSQTRMKGLARDLVYRERWTNATHRDVPSGDNGDDVSLVIPSLSCV